MTPGFGEMISWCIAHDIELVFTSSNASWLNWIECELTSLRYLTLDGSDYPSHVRWASPPRQPRRHFAANSKIRRPDHLPNAA